MPADARRCPKMGKLQSQMGHIGQIGQMQFEIGSGRGVSV